MSKNFTLLTPNTLPTERYAEYIFKQSTVKHVHTMGVPTYLCTYIQN
jgi:hypothetical protein